METNAYYKNKFLGLTVGDLRPEDATLYLKAERNDTDAMRELVRRVDNRKRLAEEKRRECCENYINEPATLAETA